MIDQFTKEDFEAFLEVNYSPFTSLGLVDGEYAYSLHLDNQVSVTIRSSVRPDSLSADVGKDSIRVWLMSGNKPLGAKGRTHRQPGWQDRLSDKINQLILWRALAGDCKECNKPKGIFKARTEANKGRPFARCREHNGFMWLDKPIDKSNIYFSEASNGTSNGERGRSLALSQQNMQANTMRPDNSQGCQADKVQSEPSSMPNVQKTNETNKFSKENDEVSNGTSTTETETNEIAEEKVYQDTKEKKNESKEISIVYGRAKQTASSIIKKFESEANDEIDKNKIIDGTKSQSVQPPTQHGQENISGRIQEDGNRKPDEKRMDGVHDRILCTEKTKTKAPNDQQRQAIEAPVDRDLRVLASPGSGKTFIIEHRYKHLVGNGISPDKIIVCTFGKQSATDMGKRISTTCPQANTEQICTINALCYRLLAKWYPDSRWYKWTGPKDWQIKSTLEDIIGPVWGEKDKPGAKEIYNAIAESKYFGLTTDDSYLWFTEVLGPQWGAWLYEIRSKFDAWLNRNRFLTFADQLFLVEQQIKNDGNFRAKVQERFSHVIVDEAQDTHYQAMRILITISLEPGQNTVYESEAE